MHIYEGILPAKQVAITSLAAMPIVALSAISTRNLFRAERQDMSERPFLVMAFALGFAVTLLPIPVPIAGATSHMCATPLLTLLVGSRVLPAITAAILLIQALFFAHGGLSTLGANTLTLGFIGPLLTLSIFKIMQLMRFPDRILLFTACFVGSLSVYVADALILAWSFMDKQAFQTTLQALLLGFLPIQGPLSLLEGLVSAAVVLYMAKHRSETVSFLRLRKPIVIYSKSAVSIMTSLMLLALAASPSELYGQQFKGIDDTVFIQTAESLGAQAKDIFPWLSGEVLLSAFSIGFLITGFIAGHAFAKWKAGSDTSLGKGIENHAS